MRSSRTELLSYRPFTTMLLILKDFVYTHTIRRRLYKPPKKKRHGVSFFWRPLERLGTVKRLRFFGAQREDSVQLHDLDGPVACAGLVPGRAWHDGTTPPHAAGSDFELQHPRALF